MAQRGRWRGYQGMWALQGNRLYPVDIHARFDDGSEVTLEALFPGCQGRVFAHWYSGELLIPEGENLLENPDDWDQYCARDLIIDIENGVMTGAALKHASPPADFTQFDDHEL